MENAVENLPPSASGVMFKNGMRGTSGNNPSFFRTTEEGEIKCWMAVDSETGAIDIRDENEKTLIEINAKTKKVFLAGLDLGRGIEEAQESADSANGEVSQAREDIEDVREKVRVAQVAADQAIEDAAEVQPALLQKIRDEGVELQHKQRLTTRQDGQLLINGKVFKGKKGDQGIQGVQGIQGIQGEKGNTGEKGESGASRVLDFTSSKQEHSPVRTEITLYEKEIDITEEAPLRLTMFRTTNADLGLGDFYLMFQLYIDGENSFNYVLENFPKGSSKFTSSARSDDFLTGPLRPGKHTFKITAVGSNVSKRAKISNTTIGVSYL